MDSAPNPQGVPPGGVQWTKPPRRHLGFPLLGGLATALATAGGLFASGAVSWLDSVCNDNPSVVASHTRSLRISLLVVWLLVGSVPCTWAVIAGQKRRTSWPWALVSGVFVGVGIVFAVTAKPTTWCLF